MNWPYIHGLQTNSLADEVKLATRWAKQHKLPKRFSIYIGQTSEYFWFGDRKNGSTIKVRKPKNLQNQSKERRKSNELQKNLFNRNRGQHADHYGNCGRIQR